MPKSLQGRLSILFIAFVLLVLISVGATYWGLETQRQDALVINLAGRQRMLVQQMTRYAMEWGDSHSDDDLSVLREAESTFELTLTALRDGGEVPYLPGQVVSISPTREPELLEKLNALHAHWLEFHAALDDVALTSSNGTIQIVQAESTDLVQDADEVVRAYQSASEARVARLRTIQIGFLVSALLLLAVSGWMTSRSLIGPLRRLEEVANRIGRNDLETRVQPEGPREMRLLAQAFESMRGNLSTSRRELVELTESLEQRVAQRTRELDALNEVSREITSHLDVQQVLDSVTEKARYLLDGEVAALCLVDDSGEWMNLQSASGPKEAVVGQRVATSAQLTEAVLGDKQALLCNRVDCPGGCGILGEDYLTSHLAAPLRVGNRVIGALCVGVPEHNRYSKESGELLTKLANTAAIALENAHLYNKAERVATLEERRRIAAEMHDGLAQTLSYLGLSIDQTCDYLEADQDENALQRLRQTRLTIQRATEDVRRAIDHLLDESPLQLGLVEQIESAVREFSSEHGLKVEWQAANGSEHQLSCPRPVLEQVIHITREALINASTHAQSDHVRVCFERVNGNFQITIEDNGRGFAPKPITDSPRRHFGLKIMKARAEHIGGQVRVESQPGSGVRVTLTWPATEEES